MPKKWIQTLAAVVVVFWCLRTLFVSLGTSGQQGIVSDVCSAAIQHADGVRAIETANGSGGGAGLGADEVLRDWEQCRVFFHLHIVKNAGTTLMKCFVEASNGTALALRGMFRPHIPGDVFKYVSSPEDMLGGGPSQRIVSAEVQLKRLRNEGWDNDGETCFIVPLRDPEKWADSALRFSVARPLHTKKINHNIFHTIENVQSTYFYELDLSRGFTVTLADVDRLDALYDLLQCHFSSRPRSPSSVRACSVETRENRSPGLKQRVDWREWADTYNPLDRELYSLVSEQSLVHVRLGGHPHPSHDVLSNRFKSLVSRTSWVKPRMANVTAYALAHGAEKLTLESVTVPVTEE
eukprot:TRINITY_DN6123_c0_g1_i1.p1 TRINITY_DN6123_c0_g1~~TRINITY_DN6123_c0_g1_i1.p1  ORF type:complete len:351 (-),score=61.73 TRINITY_DN6123_c0_g1_i1:7-1059(-)